MKHLFDVDIAIKYGIHSAILLENLGYWTLQNMANETNFYDGLYWTFNSRKAFKDLFPYMSERQINTAFQKLIDDGLVITGRYNKLAYDRTLWYALTQKGKSILHFDIMENDNISNGLNQNVTPIPNVNTDINTNKKHNNNIFIPPTVEQVRAYCVERGNSVDAEQFVDFYTSKGWIVGKTKMKDWKSAIRTWERNTSKKSEKQETYVADYTKDFEGVF